ncbi:MAG TPA: YciI family protein [Polyangiaceae bacterium]|jgi:hypothetical protein
MRFMLLMYPGAKAETGALPDPKAIAGMMKFNEELQKAGVLLALDGLQPSAKGARVRFPGGKPVVSDGPFTESKELVGGYWLIQVKSREEAIEWVKRCPCDGGEMVEIRQVFEMADFTNITPELSGTANELGKKLGQKEAAR